MRRPRLSVKKLFFHVFNCKTDEKSFQIRNSTSSDNLTSTREVRTDSNIVFARVQRVRKLSGISSLEEIVA